MKYLKDSSAPETLEISAEPSLPENEFMNNLRQPSEFKIPESPPLVINSPNAATGVDVVAQPEEEAKTSGMYSGIGGSLAGKSSSLTLKKFRGRRVLGRGRR